VAALLMFLAARVSRAHERYRRHRLCRRFCQAERSAPQNWAVNLAKGLTEPLLSCEAVLAESGFHLESSS